MGEGSKNNDPGREKRGDESVLLERAIELSGLKSRLITVLSHDLRTPLTGILTSAEIMSLNPRFEGDPALMKYTKRIMQSVKSLDLMIKNVSAVDKATRSGIKRHDQKFYISDLIEEINESAGMLLPEGASFRTLLLTQERAATGDKSLIRDVLEILIDNGIRFSGEKGEVELRLEMHEHELKFTVSDNGSGVAGEDTEELFRLFGKGKSTGHAQGAGLGLYVASHITGLLGGELKLVQNEAGGCSAIFSVPVL